MTRKRWYLFLCNFWTLVSKFYFKKGDWVLCCAPTQLFQKFPDFQGLKLFETVMQLEYNVFYAGCHVPLYLWWIEPVLKSWNVSWNVSFYFRDCSLRNYKQKASNRKLINWYSFLTTQNVPMNSSLFELFKSKIKSSAVRGKVTGVTKTQSMPNFPKIEHFLQLHWKRGVFL